jgi:hypothetical protein
VFTFYYYKHNTTPSQKDLKDLSIAFWMNLLGGLNLCDTISKSMDYLDPRKRRAYNLRLVIGYILLAIVIGLGTIIIVYGANGYGINTKTGQIIQNALLFIDSNPGGAKIYLNDKDQNTSTSARLVLPTGNYSLKLTKDGYRDWTRSFNLSEQTVARYVYPFLFPIKPVATNLKSYNEAPGLISESPDRHWLLVQSNQGSVQTIGFDQYDLTTLDQQPPTVTQISIPAPLLTNYSSSSKLTQVEWSTDNNNLLLQHTYTGGTEFIVFNRARPDQSFNVNKTFNTIPSEVSLYNKKADQLYLFDQAGGTLRLGDTGTKVLEPIILKNILAYKPYGRNLITYVTAAGELAGKVSARIWESGQSYKLNEFSTGAKYLIDAAQFAGHFYYVAGSDTADRINIYKDPLDNIKNPAVAKALPLLALHNPGAQKLSFSDNARFIGTQNGQLFAVYDIETDNLYQYPITPVLAGNLEWMDGHRYIGNSDSQVFVMDYDGTNKQTLTASSLAVGGLFNTDYNHLLTITASADGATSVLQDVDMRAGVDLPKNKQPSS